MILSEKNSEKVAHILLDINAIKLQPNNLFTWSSGKESPIYCDNRLLLSHVKERKEIKKLFCEHITKSFQSADCIAGVATGAIAHGMMVASELEMPFIYIRDKAKGHGRQNKIEGYLKKENNVVVIEDLISTGKSSVRAIQGIQDYGANVKGLLSIFTYNLCQEDSIPVPHISLCNYDTLIKVAIDKKIISNEDRTILYNWHKSY
jgi:orotate phosphoribosyltransferase